jgi:hypothetical protein
MRTPLERVKRVMEEVTGVKSLYGIDDWAWGFLVSMEKRAPETLTERQEKVLAELEQRVFGEAEA